MRSLQQVACDRFSRLHVIASAGCMLSFLHVACNRSCMLHVIVPACCM
jgi:hypothetical protein